MSSTTTHNDGDSSEELNAGHQLEALDRTHVIASMVGDFLLDHPFIAQHVQLNRKATKISNLLGELYQQIANKPEIK